jgi:hypothetical protein
VTIEKVRGLSNSRLGDFATKGSARALPCSTRLRYYYGDDIIRDTTCPLCGDPNDTQKHLFCDCEATKRSRVRIYEHAMMLVADSASMRVSEVKKVVKSCWPGSVPDSQLLKDPLQELTYLGYLPIAFRMQLTTLGLRNRQIEKLGARIAVHALRITHGMMWKVRVAAMAVLGRTVRDCMRSAGKICGVAASDMTTCAGDASSAWDDLRARAMLVDPRDNSEFSHGWKKMHPDGTVLWEEPESVPNVHLSTPTTMLTPVNGKYRYVLKGIRIQGTNHYVTTDKDGKNVKCIDHEDARKMLVHTRPKDQTRGMQTCASRIKYLNKAAVRHEGKILVVWTIKDCSGMRETTVLLYGGGDSLIATTDGVIDKEGNWLSAMEYDETTRTTIDELWAEAATMPFWYALGAKVGKGLTAAEVGTRVHDFPTSTITSVKDNNWVLLGSAGELTEATKTEVLSMLHYGRKRVKWTGTQLGRDSTTITQAISKAWDTASSSPAYTRPPIIKAVRKPYESTVRILNGTFPIGTVMWDEPKDESTWNEECDGRPNQREYAIDQGSYRYVTDTKQQQGKTVYVTTGKRLRGAPEHQVLTEEEVTLRLVHTRGAPNTGLLAHRKTAGRKAAVWQDGKIAIVWGTMYGGKIQLYSGGTKITMTEQKTRPDDETWLHAADYDETTRTAINDLLGEAARITNWYALGATTTEFRKKLCGNHMSNMGYSTVTGIDGNDWEFTSADGTITHTTEAEALNALHREFDNTTWTSTEKDRDSNKIQQAVCNASHKAHTAHTRPTTAVSRATNLQGYSTLTPQAAASNLMRATAAATTDLMRTLVRSTM